MHRPVSDDAHTRIFVLCLLGSFGIAISKNKEVKYVRDKKGEIKPSTEKKKQMKFRSIDTRDTEANAQTFRE